MAIDPNWFVTPDNIGTNALAAFDKGRERRITADYARNPSEEGLNALAEYNPDFVMKQRQQMQKEQAADEERQLLGDALANPDPAAKAAARQRLAYVNHAEYQKLGEEEKKHVDAGMEHISQLAFKIKKLPPDQQGPALQQAVEGLRAQGADFSGIDLNRPAGEILDSALAMAGKLDAWEKSAEPSYQAVGEGGLAGFQFGQPIQQGGKPQNFAPAGIEEGGPPAPPNEAIAELKADPSGAAEFDQVFGQGAAARILGGGSGNATGGFR
jgi:hypothetical protein